MVLVHALMKRGWKGDREEALDGLRKGVERGNKEAMYALAIEEAGDEEGTLSLLYQTAEKGLDEALDALDKRYS